jgi:hypothetical protein
MRRLRHQGNPLHLEPAYFSRKKFMSKNLKKRLADIESKTAAAALDRRESELLVSILARRDSLMWPWRFTISSKTPFAEIRRRQVEYFSGTAGIAVRADGKADWKTAAELRQRLIAAGLITATHSGGQVQSVFLSALGESMARGLVGDRLATFHKEGVLVLARLRELSAATSVKAVRESVLWNHACTGCPNDWDHYNELALPLLTSGLAVASSDTEGRIAYTPTDVPEPEEPVVNVESDPMFDDLYLKSFADERNMLEVCEARDPHSVFVPMPSTGWGWPCFFPQESAT